MNTYLKIGSEKLTLIKSPTEDLNEKVVFIKVETPTDSDLDFTGAATGATIVDGNGTTLTDLSAYDMFVKSVSGESESTIILSSDHTTYNNYYVTDDNGYVVGFTTTTDVLENSVLYETGVGYAYNHIEFPELKDSDGAYLYKISNGVVKNTTTTERKKIIAADTTEKLNAAIESKLVEISVACNKAIEAGVDYNDEHFSFDSNDQQNITSMLSLAIKTGLEQPYHADGKSCKMYTAAEVIGLYIAQESNLVANQTYHNQLKLYVETLTDVDAVQEVTYGQDLTGDYLTTYNTIIQQTQAIIEAFTKSE